MVGRVCTICVHAERGAIEAAIVAGTSNRDIACQFDVGRMAVQRHAADHIAEAVQSSQQAREIVSGLNIAQQLEVINGLTLAVLKETRSTFEEIAENQKQLRKEERLNLLDQVKVFKDLQMLTLQAIDRVDKQLDLQMRLSLVPPVQEESRGDGLFLQLEQLSDQARAKIRLVLVEDEKRRAS